MEVLVAVAEAAAAEGPEKLRDLLMARAMEEREEREAEMSLGEASKVSTTPLRAAAGGGEEREEAEEAAAVAAAVAAAAAAALAVVVTAAW